MEHESKPKLIRYFSETKVYYFPINSSREGRLIHQKISAEVEEFSVGEFRRYQLWHKLYEL